MTFNRKLDLSAAKEPKAVTPKKAKTTTIGGLSLRQMQQHQKAIIAVSRWTARLKRAATEVAKHQRAVKRYERLIAKHAPSE